MRAKSRGNRNKASPCDGIIGIAEFVGAARSCVVCTEALGRCKGWKWWRFRDVIVQRPTESLYKLSVDFIILPFCNLQCFVLLKSKTLIREPRIRRNQCLDLHQGGLYKSELGTGGTEE